MVEMGMGEEEVGVERTVALDALAELPQPGPGIEDQEPPAATDFEAGRIAAVALRFGTGAGETAAHAPETDEEVRPVSHSISNPKPGLRRAAFRPPADWKRVVGGKRGYARLETGGGGIRKK